MPRPSRCCPSRAFFLVLASGTGALACTSSAALGEWDTPAEATGTETQMQDPSSSEGAGGSTNEEGAIDASGRDAADDGIVGGDVPLEPTTPPPLPTADELFENVDVAELDRVRTVQVVTWSQNVASESTRLLFTFEDDEWLESPARPGLVGDHREVVLGAPEGVELAIKLVAQFGEQVVESEVFDVTNGSAPNRMPRAEIEAYDAELASPHRWMLGSVSEGGTGSYGDTHWMYVMDRQGRVVWYQPAAGGNGSLDSGYAPRIAPDGTHVSYDQLTRFDDGYVKFATLDFTYEREIRTPDIGDGHTVASDGSVIYEDGTSIWEVAPDDESADDRREVFRCNPNDFGGVPQDRGALPVGNPRATCYANAINYDPASDSVVISYPYADTALQVSRTGEVLRAFGELGGYAIDPDHELDFNHWAHITPAGTFIVSSHRAGTQVHLFNEFEIDDAAGELRLIWSYGDETVSDYPAERGMAARVEGSTTRIVNYGPTGVILELTEDGEVAWRVNFNDNALQNSSFQGTPLPQGTRGNLVHNNLLLDDLYALNRGPRAVDAPAEPAP